LRAKSAAVLHPDGTHRRLYCVESPDSWFEDFGEAPLECGEATVTLDPDFAAVAETANQRLENVVVLAARTARPASTRCVARLARATSTLGRQRSSRQSTTWRNSSLATVNTFGSTRCPSERIAVEVRV